MIFGGSDPVAPEHEATVALVPADPYAIYYYDTPFYPGTFCSGTLIAPHAVLTAAHCVVDLDTDEIMAPEDFGVYVGDEPMGDPDFGTSVWEVAEVIVHPAWFDGPSDGDIAVLLLTADVTTAAPVPWLGAANALTDLDVGTTVNFAGFGLTELGTSDKKLQVDGTIFELGCASFGCDPADESLVAYEQPDGGPCFGDSGGPMFVTRDDGVYVGGITAFGDEECTLFGASTRTDSYDAWISDLVGAPVEPGPGPSLTLGGLCPGPITIDISGITPGGHFMILHGLGPGTDVIPMGRCGGTVTGLAGVRKSPIFTADAFGNALFTPVFSDAACARSMQVMDPTTCTLSEIDKASPLL